MADFKFFFPLQVRYGDLDPQWHVNNSRYLTYMEQARFSYLTHLGLFDGESFMELGLIIADAHISFLAPITLGQKVRVGMRTTRIGNKSLNFEYLIEDETSRQALARGEVVGVAYDYHTNATIPVPQRWREAIMAFEGLAAQ